MAPIQHERKDKTGKNIDVQNFTTLSFCHFDKEKISTDSYASDDPDYWAWNNWWKTGKEKMSASTAPLHVSHILYFTFNPNSSGNPKNSEDNLIKLKQEMYRTPYSKQKEQEKAPVILLSIISVVCDFCRSLEDEQKPTLNFARVNLSFNTFGPDQSRK